MAVALAASVAVVRHLLKQFSVYLNVDGLFADGAESAVAKLFRYTNPLSKVIYHAQQTNALPRINKADEEKRERVRQAKSRARTHSRGSVCPGNTTYTYILGCVYVTAEVQKF